MISDPPTLSPGRHSECGSMLYIVGDDDEFCVNCSTKVGQ